MLLIRWYTSMLGQKSSLKAIQKYIKEKKVPNVCTTEFHQGRTMRWGIAWSFYEDVGKLPKKPKKTKKAKPFFLSLPQETLVNLGVNMTCLSLALWKVVKTLQEEFRALKISFEQPEAIFLHNKDAFELTVTAHSNTWNHQRRKRREMKKKSLLQNGHEFVKETEEHSYIETKVKSEEPIDNVVKSSEENRKRRKEDDATETNLSKKPKCDDPSPSTAGGIANDQLLNKIKEEVSETRQSESVSVISMPLPRISKDA